MNKLLLSIAITMISTSAFADDQSVINALQPSVNSCCPDGKGITNDKIIRAQSAWADAIVNIGKATHPDEVASNYIEKLYAYDLGKVLFKPTKARKSQFRGTKEEAISYFIGKEGTEDRGFALKPYTRVRFENEGIIVNCESALAMGNYYFTTIDGKEKKVEYSFGYIMDDGIIKINLHHSSIPYAE